MISLTVHRQVMSDIFLFMGSCDFYNHEDTDFVSRSLPVVNANPIINMTIKLIEIVENNAMKANQSELIFFFMMTSLYIESH